MRRPVLIPLLALAVAVAPSGCFVFDRLQAVEPGSVVGVAVNQDGAAVPYAKIALDGAGFVQRGDADGRFAIRSLPAGGWIVRASSDQTGDGVAEQATLRAIYLAETTLDGVPAIPTVLLGDVEMKGTAVLVATVRDDGDDVVAGCKVAVWRNAAALAAEGAMIAAGGARPAACDLGVEASAGSDEGGRARLPGVTHGDVLVGAFCADGRAADPVPAHAVAGPDVVVDALRLRAPRERPARIMSSPALAPGATLRVLFTTPGGDRTSSADVVHREDVDAARTISVTAPTGLWDVHVVALEDGVETRYGVLARRAVPPGEDAIVWGDVLLEDEDPCEAARPDRDRDGVPGVPLDDASARATCDDVCAAIAAFGSGGDAPALCEHDGVLLDCDDDDDGQPDVTEPIACVGACFGTDLDGDGACDPGDPFPGCAENDPAAAACAAEEQPFTPPPVVDIDGDDDAGVPPVDGGTVPVDGGASIDGGFAFDGGGPFDSGFVFGDGGSCDATPPCGATETASIVCQAQLQALAGCTALQVLTISGPDVTDLAPLASLAVVDTLVIGPSALVDLDGLSGLTSLTTLGISGASSLTTLAGLPSATAIPNVTLQSLPSLTDVSALGGPAAAAVPEAWTFGDLPAVDTVVPGPWTAESLSVYGVVGGAPFSQLSSAGSLILSTLTGTAAPSFSSLVDVDTLSISSNPQLADLSGLAALQTVQSLYVATNSALPHLADLVGLDSIVSVLQLADNDVMTSPGTLPVTNVGLIVASGDALLNLGSYPNLTSLGPIQASVVPSLTSVATLPAALTSISSVTIDGATVLSDLYGLESVATIEGGLTVRNGGLAQVQALQQLKVVNGQTTFENLPSLQNLDGLMSLTSTFGLRVAEAPLGALPDFPSLTRVSTLDLEDLPQLTNMGTYPVLTEIDNLYLVDLPLAENGGLATSWTAAFIDVIRTNFAAPPVGSPSIVSSTLSIRQNPSLVSLTTLANVSEVGSLLEIVDNPALDTCAAQAFAASAAGVATTVVVTGNAPADGGC